MSVRKHELGCLLLLMLLAIGVLWPAKSISGDSNTPKSAEMRKLTNPNERTYNSEKSEGMDFRPYWVTAVGCFTAIVLLLVAFTRLRTARLQLEDEKEKRCEVEGKSQLLRRRLEDENTQFNVSVENLSNLLIPEEHRTFVSSLVRLYFTEEANQIVEHCRKIARELNNSVPNWPSILEGAAQILSDKCHRADEFVSEHVFEALRKVCDELHEEYAIGIFTKLIKGDAKPHVRRNAIIEFTEFCREKSAVQNIETQDRYAELMLDIITYLGNADEGQQWDKDSIRRARAAVIADLRIFNQAPHILNKLLPKVFLLVNKDLKVLLPKLSTMVGAINVERIDRSIREDVAKYAEDVWLKEPRERCSVNLKTVIVNTVIRRLRPSRRGRIRIEEIRLPLRNKVELFLPDDQNIVKGVGIDVTPQGFCVSVDAILEGSDFQIREHSDPPLSITSGKTYQVSIAELSVLDHSGSTYEVEKQKVEILRGAKHRQEGTPLGTTTVLAGRVVEPATSWKKLIQNLMTNVENGQTNG